MKGACHVLIRFIMDFLKIWHLQLIYWKMQCCCCPEVGHLHAYLFKPHCGVFVWTAQHSLRHLQLPPHQKNDKCLTNAQGVGGGGMGMLGIDWAITFYFVMVCLLINLFTFLGYDWGRSSLDNGFDVSSTTCINSWFIYNRTFSP